ncbi:unnamed protein product [Durusdinium trenchii]|uniref:RNase III domain-containing protein n=1 Tax=Durusdinium trenchii TaxID=1381693 RepID=A0ABP0L324_9DINO
MHVGCPMGELPPMKRSGGQLSDTAADGSTKRRRSAGHADSTSPAALGRASRQILVGSPRELFREALDLTGRLLEKGLRVLWVSRQVRSRWETLRRQLCEERYPMAISLQLQDLQGGQLQPLQITHPSCLLSHLLQGRDLNFHLIFDNCGFSFVTEACLALLRQPHYLLQPFPGSDDEHHWLRAASAASSALRVVWALRPRRLVPLAPSCSILSVVGELLRKKNEVLVVTEDTEEVTSLKKKLSKLKRSPCGLETGLGSEMWVLDCDSLQFEARRFKVILATQVTSTQAWHQILDALEDDGELFEYQCSQSASEIEKLEHLFAWLDRDQETLGQTWDPSPMLGLSVAWVFSSTSFRKRSTEAPVQALVVEEDRCRIPGCLADALVTQFFGHPRPVWCRMESVSPVFEAEAYHTESHSWQVCPSKWRSEKMARRHAASEILRGWTNAGVQVAEKLLELFKENMTCPFLLEFYMTLRLPPLQPEVELYSYALRLEDQSFAPLLIISAEDWGKKRTHFLEDVPVLLGSKIHQKSMELDVQFAKKLRLSPGDLLALCTWTRKMWRVVFDPSTWHQVCPREPAFVVAPRSPMGEVDLEKMNEWINLPEDCSACDLKLKAPAPRTPVPRGAAPPLPRPACVAPTPGVARAGPLLAPQVFVDLEAELWRALRSLPAVLLLQSFCHHLDRATDELRRRGSCCREVEDPCAGLATAWKFVKEAAFDMKKSQRLRWLGELVLSTAPTWTSLFSCANDNDASSAGGPTGATQASSGATALWAAGRCQLELPEWWGLFTEPGGSAGSATTASRHLQGALLGALWHLRQVDWQQKHCWWRHLALLSGAKLGAEGLPDLTSLTCWISQELQDAGRCLRGGAADGGATPVGAWDARLAALGMAVLRALLGQELFDRFPNWGDGHLSRLLGRLTSKAWLSRRAERLFEKELPGGWEMDLLDDEASSDCDSGLRLCALAGTILVDAHGQVMCVKEALLPWLWPPEHLLMAWAMSTGVWEEEELGGFYVIPHDRSELVNCSCSAQFGESSTPNLMEESEEEPFEVPASSRLLEPWAPETQSEADVPPEADRAHVPVPGAHLEAFYQRFRSAMLDAYFLQKKQVKVMKDGRWVTSYLRFHPQKQRFVLPDDDEPISASEVRFEEAVSEEPAKSLDFRAEMSVGGPRGQTLLALGVERSARQPRFHRKYGSDRFLRVRWKQENGESSCSAQQLKQWLRGFAWLGRWWELLRPNTKSKAKCHGGVFVNDSDFQVTFFAVRPCTTEEEAWSPGQQLASSVAASAGGLVLPFPHVSAAEARQFHIPTETTSGCPAECEQHFLCREGRKARPEQELLKNPSKYCKRLDLGFSDVIPTIVLQASEIHDIEDLRTTSNAVASDGCGRIGWKLAERVAKLVGLDYVPSLFQARLGCCKGCWLVDFRKEFWYRVYNTRSMYKWKIDWASSDELLRTFEVKDYSRKTASKGLLNTQLIAVLEAGGVPLQIFQELQKAELCNFEEEKFGTPGMPQADPKSEGIAQLAVRMFDAGLDPRQEPAGWDSLVQYHLGTFRRLRQEAHYGCSDSWRAKLAPDFTRKLLEFEAIFKLPGGAYFEGAALLSRSPCTAPWDVQRFRFLGQEEILERFGTQGYPFLHDDVIILSSHEECRCPPADYLAGGDFDGDDALLLGHAKLVAAFQPSRKDDVACQLAAGFGKKANVPAEHLGTVHLEESFDLLCEVEKNAICNGFLVGQLGNLWSYLADQKGAKEEKTIQVGLLFQLALDGKLPEDLDFKKIKDALQIQEPGIPHWHPKAHSARHTRHSESILGELYDGLEEEEQKLRWRNQYAGEFCKNIHHICDVTADFDKVPGFLDLVQKHLEKARKDFSSYVNYLKGRRDPAACRQKARAYMEMTYPAQELKYMAVAFHRAGLEFLRESLNGCMFYWQKDKILMHSWDIFKGELLQCLATQGFAKAPYPMDPGARTQLQRKRPR